MNLRPATSLLLALLSFLFFPLEIMMVERSGRVATMLLVALPGLLLGSLGLIHGLRNLARTKGGKAYGQAMGASLVGGFAIVFWCVLVPFMVFFALPARQQDSRSPDISQSIENMQILIRHCKTFQRDFGRMPVKVEELVEKNYTPLRTLYDPRDPLKEVPSYRLMIRELPPESDWDSVPMLEGRWPDAQGRRLLAYPNERIGHIDGGSD